MLVCNIIDLICTQNLWTEALATILKFWKLTSDDITMQSKYIVSLYIIYSTSPSWYIDFHCNLIYRLKIMKKGNKKSGHRQTHKHTYIQCKNRGNLFFPSCFLFIHFCFSDTFESKKVGFQKTNLTSWHLPHILNSRTSFSIRVHGG